MPEPHGFEGAVALLPTRLRGSLLFLPPEIQGRTEEIRLRCGQRLCLTLPEGCRELPEPVTASDIQETLDRASHFSFHTVQESMKQGFLTASGGYRIGLGGSVILQDGQVQGFRTVASLNLRIPHSVSCISPRLFARLKGHSVLICSPPGAGKTTFLRELGRLHSEAGYRVAVADERGEIAALCSGVPQLPVGRNTDVLEFCPKSTAAELLLRGMNPHLLVLDELTHREAELLSRIAAAGTALLATAHAASRQELGEKGIPLGRFSRLVWIRLRDGLREYIVEEEGEC